MAKKIELNCGKLPGRAATDRFLPTNQVGREFESTSKPATPKYHVCDFFIIQFSFISDRLSLIVLLHQISAKSTRRQSIQPIPSWRNGLPFVQPSPAWRNSVSHRMSMDNSSSTPMRPRKPATGN